MGDPRGRGDTEGRGPPPVGPSAGPRRTSGRALCRVLSSTAGSRARHKGGRPPLREPAGRAERPELRDALPGASALVPVEEFAGDALPTRNAPSGSLCAQGARPGWSSITVADQKTFARRRGAPTRKPWPAVTSGTAQRRTETRSARSGRAVTRRRSTHDVNIGRPPAAGEGRHAEDRARSKDRCRRSCRYSPSGRSRYPPVSGPDAVKEHRGT